MDGLDGWMDECMDGWMDRLIVRSTDRSIDRSTDRSMDRSIDQSNENERKYMKMKGIHLKMESNRLVHDKERFFPKPSFFLI